MDPLDDYLRSAYRTPGDIEADIIRRGGSLDIDIAYRPRRKTRKEGTNEKPQVHGR